jgi:dethiobiotin synthetase/adenosylmethionine--8-amino-7-oxononanoate aminotransferase
MMGNVRRVIGQGCVLAVELEVEGEGGYSSNAAREVVMRLRPHGIQARPLGNVVYLMCAPTTSKDKCDRLLDSLTIELSEH